MAKDKQKSVPLGQAWQEYWAILFQGDGDWKSSLERVIFNRVVLLEFGVPAIGNMSPQQDLPNWAHGMRIALNTRTVSMSIGDLKPLTCPLFFEAMTAESPRWKAQHPIKKVVEAGSDSRQLQKLWENDCQKILIRATIGVGKAIRQALGIAIQDGVFIVYGRPSDSPFKEPEAVQQTVFSDLFELNFDNTITVGAGDAKISSISLIPVADITADQPPSNSFKEADLILVEEMKQLIDNDKVSSIKVAANQVLIKANRQNDAAVDSVVERLRRRFGGKYPNYMKKKSN